eukprot:scaffold8211_cov117-Cylindrotheca_fusiformis.AAC.9
MAMAVKQHLMVEINLVLGRQPSKSCPEPLGNSQESAKYCLKRKGYIEKLHSARNPKENLEECPVPNGEKQRA